jgi:hypothetical protein
MINVSHNRQCVMASRETIAPIREVPYIVLYVSGKFIVEVARKVQANQSFNRDDQRVKEDPKGGIPAYTIGKPLHGPDDKVCYLEFNDAYGNNNTGPERTRPRQHLPNEAGMGIADPSGMG